ncbi:MAG: Gfo/Idh/MocA family protein [Phycisphaeraceae bacterium]
MLKRIAIAGAGIRGLGFAKALLDGGAGPARLVGLLDTNRRRMAGFCELLGQAVPAFTDLGALVAETQPDALLVCTPDHTHPAVIERGFAAGLAVITEKPMAIDAPGLGCIVAAEREAGRSLRLAFNMRYMPVAAKVRKLLAEGAIGQVRSVSADWFIDRTHGTEYFRRWHAHMDQSGGLLVHKATHHFDLLNWFIGDAPQRVAAFGSLEMFGGAGPYRGERCRGCEHLGHCWAAMPQDYLDPAEVVKDASRDHLRKLYFDAEAEDGYLRDRCVFRESVDIHDTASVLVQYRNGAQLSYSMTAYSPYQGFAIALTGTNGRMEVKSISPATRSADMGDQDTIRIITGQRREDVVMRNEDMPVETATHGGGDERMLRDLFADRSGGDPLRQRAGSREGAFSALIGICANRAIAEGRMIDVPEPTPEALAAFHATAPDEATVLR